VGETSESHFPQHVPRAIGSLLSWTLVPSIFLCATAINSLTQRNFFISSVTSLEEEEASLGDTECSCRKAMMAAVSSFHLFFPLFFSVRNCALVEVALPMAVWCFCLATVTVCALFVWLISHQPAVLFSHNKSATSNQSTVLFFQNKPAPAISHQTNEQPDVLCLELEGVHCTLVETNL
jgi:hypothetical protein